VTYIPIPVAVAHQIGDGHKKDIVLIVGWDEASNKTAIVTWGREPPQKEAAAKAGETIAKQLGLLDDLADVHEDFRREGEAALEVDRLRLLAVELWNVRGHYSLSVEDEEKMLARFPWLRAVSVDSPA